MWTFLMGDGKAALTSGQAALIQADKVALFVAFSVVAFGVLYLTCKKRTIPCSYIGYFFATFLFLSGLSHGIGAFLPHYPMLFLYMSVTTVAAVTSLVAALLFVPTVPRILSMPTPVEYESILTKLQHDELELRKHRETLEKHVLQRNLLEQEVATLRDLHTLRVGDRDETKLALNRMDDVLTRLETVVRDTYPEMLTAGG